MSLSPSALGIAAAVGAGLIGLYSAAAAVRTHLPWARWRVAALGVCRLLLLAAVGAWCLGLRVEVPRSAGPVEMVVLADRSPSISAAGRREAAGWTARARAAMKRLGGSMTVIEVGASGRSSPLSEALSAARASFTGRGDKRILLLSDGRATTADPLTLAAALAREGVACFAVPIEPLAGESVLAELAVPAAMWRAVPSPVQAVLRSASAGACKLTLRVDGEVARQRTVQLGAGLMTAVEMPVVLAADGVHRLEVRAEFAGDQLEWNNAASALVDVPLAPRVVIVSRSAAVAGPLAAALAASGLAVGAVGPGELPARLACDAIVLDDVSAKALGQPRMRAMEAFVRGGGGIVFTGGRSAYGAGGYLATPLEGVFPVLLRPRKEYPPYALAVVLDNSWSMNEGLTSAVGKIDIAKEIAIAAMEGLNRGDWLTLVSFDSDYHEIIAPTKVADLAPARYEVSRIGAFGMTNILGGLLEAARKLPGIDAPYKHILLISDGKETETGTDYSRLLASLQRQRVTLSAIAVGLNPNLKLLNTLAYGGKGRFYRARSLKEVPAAVLQEARSLADQLVVDLPLPARKLEDDPALAGIDVEALPALGGYNRSRARPHAWTPLVISPKQDPLLARMRYGRGQALAFLSAATGPWAADWMNRRPKEYVTFWRQAVASVLGPPHRPLAPATDWADGWPVFDLSACAPAGGELRVHRLAGGKVLSAAAGAEVRAAGAEAVLATSRGPANRAFAWSRTYGREFGDLTAGHRTLGDLCRITGGAYEPKGDEPFAPGRSAGADEVAPEAWLLAAAALLAVELLLRRLPALTGLLRRRQPDGANRGV